MDSSSSTSMHGFIKITVPTKTYDGSSSSFLKKRKVLHVTSSSDRHVDKEGTMACLTALISGHGEEASIVPTNNTTRVDDIMSENSWDMLLMGGRKDSLMLTKRRLGKSSSSQSLANLKNEEWGEQRKRRSS